MVAITSCSFTFTDDLIPPLDLLCSKLLFLTESSARLDPRSVTHPFQRVSSAGVVVRVEVSPQIIQTPKIVNDGDVLQNILERLTSVLAAPFLLRILHRSQIRFTHHS